MIQSTSPGQTGALSGVVPCKRSINAAKTHRYRPVYPRQRAYYPKKELPNPLTTRFRTLILSLLPITVLIGSKIRVFIVSYMGVLPGYRK